MQQAPPASCKPQWAPCPASEHCESTRKGAVQADAACSSTCHHAATSKEPPYHHALRALDKAKTWLQGQGASARRRAQHANQCTQPVLLGVLLRAWPRPLLVLPSPAGGPPQPPLLPGNPGGNGSSCRRMLDGPHKVHTRWAACHHASGAGPHCSPSAWVPSILRSSSSFCSSVASGAMALSSRSSLV